MHDERLSNSTDSDVGADAQVRQRNLQIALDAVAAEDGPLSYDEIDQLVREARRRSTVVNGSNQH